MTKFINKNKLIGSSVRTKPSTLSADIIPKWEYIRTPSVDMNKLGDI